MGEVYRARDSKLNRDVAIKVLLPGLTVDPDRLARFSREAQLLASLNHTNIAQIYGLEEHRESANDKGLPVFSTALVMEFVEGEDLAQRLARGAIPLDEALPIARQIAEALEAAHEHGVVHRDLKPANIKVRPDGAVKVLDFGLAKALEPGGTRAPGAQLSDSPTISMHATHAGVILGTAAYMSPEQARGRAVDRRTDIWAFGCVLYEMLAGARAFPGHDITDLIVAVVSKEPSWHALPDVLPAAIRRLLRRCLEKDPKRRLDSAAALRIEIDDAMSATLPGASGSDRPQEANHASPANRTVALRSMGVAALAALGGAALTGTIVWSLAPGRTASADVTRTLISVAPAEILRAIPADEPAGEGRPSRTAFALSPDGRSLVFSGVADGRQQLFLRPLDQLHARPIPGSDDGHSPFFSPDGLWIGFQSGRSLKKVLAAGGAPPTTICEADMLYGASWGSKDAIVFATSNSGLWQVTSGGGTPRLLTALDRSKGEFSHRLPYFLPDGSAVVFTVTGLYLPSWDDARLAVVNVASGERRDIGPGADGRYLSSGHLIYMLSGKLIAAPFNVETREFVGDALTLEEVMQAANMPNSVVDTGAGQYALSHSGALLYLPGGIYPDREKTIVVADRRGRTVPLPIAPRPFFAPLLSPDESRLVVWTQGIDRNLWTYDLARGTLTKLTTQGRNHRGIWTPDGKRIIYAGGVGGAYNLFSIPADGSGPPEQLTTSPETQHPSSWTPDGKTLVFLNGIGTGATSAVSSISSISPAGDRQERTIHQSKSSLLYPEVSPDGHWLAYVSNESGRNEVYVQPYPGPGARRQISNAGGVTPAWARNGRELFYTTASDGHLRMMSVSITLAPFTAGSPQALFEGVYGLQSLTRGYSVTADGQKFYLTQVKERPSVRATHMVLVENWAEEVKRRVPPR
jgi:serine/threonine-protein kinase